MATQQRVRAVDLLADGIVHHVVPELDGEGSADLALAVAAEVSAPAARAHGGDGRRGELIVARAVATTVP